MAFQTTELKTLQILRAIAATSVVYFHTHTNFRSTFGTFGVDIFFVISGFVMAMVVTTGVTPLKFAYSRLSRIIPLYWIFTSMLLVLASIKPELLNSTTANFSNYLKSIFFIPYFKENGELYPMLSVGWTLNYEIFFYACIWLSIVISRKMYVWITCVLMGSAYLILGKYLENQVTNAFFGNEVLFEFLFGIFTYKIYKYQPVKSSFKFSLMAVGLLSYCFMAIAEVYGFDVSRTIIYGIPSVLVVYSIVQLEQTIIKLPKPMIQTFVMIGNASYATYLSHFYVVDGCKKILSAKYNIIDSDSLTGAFIMMSIALLFGQMIYMLIDKPLTRFLKFKAVIK